MAPAKGITSDQRLKEHSIVFALVADAAIMSAFVVVGLLGGSLTILAESIRGWLMIGTEGFSLSVLRRIHRGVVADFEFGPGKLEQVANLAIAGGMLAGAVWIAVGMIDIVLGDKVVGAPMGLMLAAAFGSINTFINVVAWDGVRRAARTGNSVIMAAQLRARVVKLVSSVFVQFTMTFAAISTDHVVAIWADGIGALFVAGYMVSNARQMLKAGLPDIIDRAAEEGIQMGINRALAHHFDEYEWLDGVRSRRSGETIFVELGLRFAGSLTIAEVTRRTENLKTTLRAEVRNAEITIVSSSHGA